MIKKGLNFLIQTKGYIQFLNVLIQFLLNYMIINSFGTEGYGYYLYYSTITIFVVTIFFSGFNNLLKKHSLKDNPKVLSFFFLHSILFFSIYFFIRFLLNGLVEENILRVVDYGLVANTLCFYDHYLLGKKNIFSSRIFLILSNFLFLIFLITQKDLTKEGLIFLYFKILILKGLTGWFFILYKDFNRIKISIQDLRFFLAELKFNFLAELISPIISKADKLILGTISLELNGIYGAFNIVPNSLKTTFKFLSVPKLNYYLNSNKNIKQKKSFKYFYKISTLLFIFSSIFLTISYAFILKVDLRFWWLSIIFTITSLLKYLGEMTWSFNIYNSDSKEYFKKLLISNLIYISLLSAISPINNLLGLIISMIVFDSYLFYHGFKLSKEKSYL